MIRAFEKAGWTVTDNPLSIRIPDSKGYIFADVCLENKQEKQVIIVVEIKCFPDSRSKLDEFYHAIAPVP